MANNSNPKNSFSKLKRDILLKVLVIVLGSVIVGLIFLFVFVDGIFQDSFAQFMINSFQFLGLGQADANFLYFSIFMNRKTAWLLAGLLIILSIAFYIALSQLTKYFDEVTKGVDELTKEKTEPIRLSPQLDFMEEKLNDVNDKLKQREMEAKEAEQRKNDLVVYLAHDIKTPLTSIVGYLNLLKESPHMSVENRAKYTDITLEKAYRLEELINEFFDITRFNLQSIVLDRTKVDIGLMLMQITDEFYPSFEEKNLSADLNVEDNLIIYGDSQKLARVFNNIIKNAISYSMEDSVIQIKSSKDNNNIILEISNEGDTIPQDKLDDIFEKFYRLDKSRSTDKGGSGLGLAIAKEIVIAHKGSILAESADGVTTFIIKLPFE